MSNARTWTVPVSGILAVALVSMLVAPLVRASEPATPPMTDRLLATAATAKVAALDPAMVRPTMQSAPATTPAPAPEQKSFFKTGKGAAVLVLLAGGLGYTIYSARNERINSAYRQ